MEPEAESIFSVSKVVNGRSALSGRNNTVRARSNDVCNRRQNQLMAASWQNSISDGP
jgi:hypothetical protein